MIRIRGTPKPGTKRMATSPRPIWLRRLDVVRAELASVRFPRTADESLRLCASLSAASLRALHGRPRREHPGVGVADLIVRWDHSEATLSRPTRRGGRHQH